MPSTLKRLAKTVAEPFRPHMPPSFLIVGAQKAGTSALFSTLAGHPAIIAPAVKEMDFFSHDERHAKGLGHYLARFPLRPWRYEAQISFEASPSYLDHPEAAARIKALFPDMRIIIVLRDPVKRAFSAWNMYRQFKGHPQYGDRYDARPFEEAVRQELEGRSIGPIRNYLERGRYAPQVRRYLDAFPAANVLVLPYTGYKADPKRTLDQVCDLVGIERFTEGHPALRTRSNTRPYAHALPESLKQDLYAYYAPSMAELRQVVGTAADLCEDAAYEHLWA